MNQNRVVVLAFFILTVLEVMLLLATAADLRPRSRSAIDALFTYVKHPDAKTRAHWEEELSRVNHAVRMKRVIGCSLLFGNGVAMFFLGRRLVARNRAESGQRRGRRRLPPSAVLP